MNFKIKTSAIFLLASLLIGTFAGCSYTHSANPSATDNGNTTDPVQQVEVISDQKEGGCISKESYSDKTSAVVAFLDNEISGQATNAVFVSYETVRELNPEDIFKLSLGNLKYNDIEYAEMGIVTYKDGEPESEDSKLKNDKTIKVFIIEMGEAFYYFTPAPETGDVLTKSYFDYINQSSKYENVIFEYKYEIKANALSPLGNSGYDFNTDSTVKVTGNVAHMTSNVAPGEQSSNFDFSAERYFVLISKKKDSPAENPNGADSYIAVFDKYGEDWTEVDMESFNMSDLASPIFNSGDSLGIKIDNAYYIKTEDGFKMNEEKVDLWIDTLIKYSILPNIFDENTQFSYDSIKTDGDVEHSYIVSNGRVRKVVTKCNISLSGVVISDGSEKQLDLTYERSTEMSYKDFGSTGNIEIPNKILQQIEAKGYEVVKKKTNK